MLKRQELLLTTVLVILAARTSLNAASVGFKPEQNYPVGTNADDGSVSILFGKGDGKFQTAKNVAIGRNCTTLVAGDFNGDGNDDLALLRPGNPTVNDDGDVTIFLGNGDGTFRQGQVLTPGKDPSMAPQGMIAIDLNRDQRLDLVVANSGDQTFSVLLGNGDGSFHSAVAYPVTNPPSQIVVVDLTGNGEKDLAVVRTAGVDFWLSNGDGTFRQGPSVVGISGVTAGDFNGDKKDDLVVVPFFVCIFHCGGGGTNFPKMLLGNGDGTFQPAISIGEPAFDARDFDGDGKLDLVGINSNNGSAQIVVSLGNGDGTFQQPVAFAMNSNEVPSRVLDVNGDSAPDLVMIVNNTIGLLLNVGTDFSISASALSPSTLSPGQSATSTISLSLLSTFDNPVSLACSVKPAQAGSPACSLSSNSVTLDGSGQASATLTINAGSSVASRNSSQSFGKGGLLSFPVTGFAFLGIGVGFSRKRRLSAVLIAAVLFAGLITQLACGGGSGGPKSTAYTVTVTGSSGATQHSATVNVTVQ